MIAPIGAIAKVRSIHLLFHDFCPYTPNHASFEDRILDGHLSSFFLATYVYPFTPTNHTIIDAYALCHTDRGDIAATSHSFKGARAMPNGS